MGNHEDLSLKRISADLQAIVAECKRGMNLTRLKDIVPRIEAASAQDPSEAEFPLYLGLIYRILNELDVARSYFEIVLLLEPRNSTALKLIRKTLGKLTYISELEKRIFIDRKPEATEIRTREMKREFAKET